MRQTKPDKYRNKRKHESLAVPEWDQSQYTRKVADMGEQAETLRREELIAFIKGIQDDELEHPLWRPIHAAYAILDYFGDAELSWLFDSCVPSSSGDEMSDAEWLDMVDAADERASGPPPATNPAPDDALEH